MTPKHDLLDYTPRPEEYRGCLGIPLGLGPRTSTDAPGNARPSTATTVAVQPGTFGNTLGAGTRDEYGLPTMQL